MFNFHGGTVVSALTLFPISIYLLFKYYTGIHSIIVIALLIINIFTFFLLITTLSRFFINLKNWRSGLKNPGINV